MKNTNRRVRSTKHVLYKALGVTLFSVLVSACVTEIDPMDESFRDSVDGMISKQTYEMPPVAERAPSSHTPDRLNGKLGETIFTNYRTTAGKAETVKSESLEIRLK